MAQHDQVGPQRPAGLRDGHDPFDRLVEREGDTGADAPRGGQPDMRDELVGVGLDHLAGVVGIEHIWRGVQVEVVGDRDRFDLLVVSHSCGFQVGPEVAVDEAHRREVLDAREADLLEVPQEDRHQPERIRAVDAGEDRDVLDDGQDFGRHVDDDRIGVAVGHHPRQRAAPGHAVAARVVDDDQVGAAGLGALGREARAGAGSDDRPPARDRGVQLRERFGALHAVPPR